MNFLLLSNRKPFPACELRSEAGHGRPAPQGRRHKGNPQTPDGAGRQRPGDCTAIARGRRCQHGRQGCGLQGSADLVQEGSRQSRIGVRCQQEDRHWPCSWIDVRHPRAIMPANAWRIATLPSTTCHTGPDGDQGQARDREETADRPSAAQHIRANHGLRSGQSAIIRQGTISSERPASSRDRSANRATAYRRRWLRRRHSQRRLVLDIVSTPATKNALEQRRGFQRLEPSVSRASQRRVEVLDRVRPSVRLALVRGIVRHGLAPLMSRSGLTIPKHRHNRSRRGCAKIYPSSPSS